MVKHKGSNKDNRTCLSILKRLHLASKASLVWVATGLEYSFCVSRYHEGTPVRTQPCSHLLATENRSFGRGVKDSQTGRSWAPKTPKTPKTSWALSLENCGPAVHLKGCVDCRYTVDVWDSETHNSLKPYQLLIGFHLQGLETWTHETSVPTNEGDTSSRNTSRSGCLRLTSWISRGKATENLPQWVGQRSRVGPEE